MDKDMTSEKELRELVEKARCMGALVEVAHDAHATATEGRQVIDMVRVVGVKGIGPFPMPAIAAAEALRQFVNSNVRNCS
jgi:hypothetical protein